MLNFLFIHYAMESTESQFRQKSLVAMAEILCYTVGKHRNEVIQ